MADDVVCQASLYRLCEAAARLVGQFAEAAKAMGMVGYAGRAWLRPPRRGFVDCAGRRTALIGFTCTHELPWRRAAALRAYIPWPLAHAASTSAHDERQAVRGLSSASMRAARRL